MSLLDPNSPYRTAIHCVDSISGKTGCFLYRPEVKWFENKFEAESPVFDDLLKLFDYCHQNNITTGY